MTWSLRPRGFTLAVTLLTLVVSSSVLGQMNSPNGIEPSMVAEDDAIDSESEHVLGQGLASGVDERPLWRMLEQKEHGHLRSWIKKLRSTYPDWSPPRKMMTLLNERNSADENQERSDKIQNLRASENWPGLLEFSRQHPRAFNCTSIHNIWTLGDAYAALGHIRKLTSLYATVIESCPRAKERIVTLQRAMSQLPYRWTEALLEREAKNPRKPGAQNSFNAFRYRFYSAWLADAIVQHVPAGSHRLARMLAKGILIRRDVDNAILLGWFNFKQEAYPQASEWFSRALTWEQRPAAAYNLALTHLRLKQPEKAKLLAKMWLSREPAMAGILLNSRMLLAQRAYDKGDFSRSLTLLRRGLKQSKRDGLPHVIVRPVEVFEAWNLFKLGEFDEAAAAFERLYRVRPDQESVEGLIHSHLKRSSHRQAVDLANKLKGPLHAVIRPHKNGNDVDLSYLFYTSWLHEAVGANDFTVARDAGHRIATLIVKRRDPENAVSLGWVHLKLHDAAGATTWFENALAWQESSDAALGLALAYQERGDVSAAETVARGWADRSPELRRLMADLLLARAGDAYDEGAFEQSLDLTGESLTYRAASRGTSLLNAWNHYQLGQYGEAIAGFEALYREEPDEQSARGFLASAEQLGEPSRAANLSAELGGPLPALWRESTATRYANQKLFLAAAETDAQAISGLESIGAPSLMAGGYFRTRSGEEGLAKLDLYAAVVEAAATHGRHKASLRLTTLGLHSGTPSPSARLGTRDSDPQVVAPTTSINGVVEPLLSYRHEGEWMPYLELGLTPLGAEIGSRVFGKLGVEHQHRRGFWRGDLFAKPKRDSILSYTGIVDPATGDHWGRVVETGLSAEALQLVGDRWSVVAGVAASELTGRDVDHNRRLHLALSPGHSFSSPGFDYLTLGPAYAFETYEKNLSQFTLGQGGYFSPESFHKGGLALNFLTSEGADFIVRGSVFAGYQKTVEEDAPFFPLDPTGGGGQFRAPTLDGVASDADIVGVLKVGKHFQLGGSFRYIVSPNFNDYTGGLFLRYILDPRQAAFSSDLPDFIRY